MNSLTSKRKASLFVNPLFSIGLSVGKRDKLYAGGEVCCSSPSTVNHQLNDVEQHSYLTMLEDETREKAL